MASLPAVKSVLLVEDDEAASDALAHIIRSKGVAVKAARTVAGAKEMLSPCAEVVLLDLGLPDGSGVEVLDALRKCGCESRVIVVTGLGSESVDTAKVWEHHIEAVLPKPLSLHLLFYLLGL